MPTKEALRQRIELVESRICGQPIGVVNLRMRATYALADIIANGFRKFDMRYTYRHFFKASKLRSYS